MDLDGQQGAVLPPHAQALAVAPYLVFDSERAAQRNRQLYRASTHPMMLADQGWQGAIARRLAQMSEDDFVQIYRDLALREEWQHTLDEPRWHASERSGLSKAERVMQLLQEDEEGAAESPVAQLAAESLARFSEGHEHEFGVVTEGHALLQHLCQVPSPDYQVVGLQLFLFGLSRRFMRKEADTPMPHEIGARALMFPVDLALGLPQEDAAEDSATDAIVRLAQRLVVGLSTIPPQELWERLRWQDAGYGRTGSAETAPPPAASSPAGAGEGGEGSRVEGRGEGGGKTDSGDSHRGDSHVPEGAVPSIRPAGAETGKVGDAVQAEQDTERDE